MQSVSAAVAFFREDIKTFLGLDETKPAIAEIIRIARMIEWSHKQQISYLPVLTGVRSNSIRQWLVHWRITFSCPVEFASPFARLIKTASYDVDCHLGYIEELWQLYKAYLQNDNARKRVEALVIKQGLSYLYKIIVEAAEPRRGTKAAAKQVIWRLKCFWETGVRRTDFDEFAMDSIRQYLMPAKMFEEGSKNPGPLYAREEVFRPLVEFIKINQKAVA